MKQEDCDWRTKERRRLKEIKKKNQNGQRLKPQNPSLKYFKLKANEYLKKKKKKNFTRMRRNFSSDSTDKTKENGQTRDQIHLIIYRKLPEKY